jgi:DnaJ-domain-containing protein 1
MFLNQLQTKAQKEAFLELAHYVAKLDGAISSKEQEYLETYLYEMDMTPDEYQPQDKELRDILAIVEGEEVRNIFLLEILGLIFADGEYHSEEKKAVETIKLGFGISEERYEACKTWVRKLTELYQEGVRLTGAQAG